MKEISSWPHGPVRPTKCRTPLFWAYAVGSRVQPISRGITAVYRCILIACLLQVSIGHAPASAQPAEPIPWALLPNYCAESELSPNYKRFGVRWQYWTNLMGPNFNRIHHYCQGLVHLMRAKRMSETEQTRRVVLKLAIGEFNFILNGQDAWNGFPLLPEMLVRKGEAASLLQDWTTAYTAFLDARKAKPDYWPAYLGWAEILFRIGKREEARSLLLEGLSFSPDSEPLRKLFVQAGGLIEDIPAKVVPTVPASAPASAASAPSPALRDAPEAALVEGASAPQR